MAKKRKNKSINKGTIVIEMTLLMPVFLGIIYFYLFFFLFFIEQGECAEYMTECLYDTDGKADVDGKNSTMTIRKEGQTEIISLEKGGTLFDIQLEYRKQSDCAVKNIRRWKVAADMLH